MRNALICSAFALTGRKPTHACLPKVLPWAVGFCLFEACINDAALFDALPQKLHCCHDKESIKVETSPKALPQKLSFSLFGV